MVLSWEITKQDAANYIACVNRAAWKPTSFEPPELDVVNPALGKKSSIYTGQLQISEGFVGSTRVHWQSILLFLILLFFLRGGGRGLYNLISVPSEVNS